MKYYLILVVLFTSLPALAAPNDPDCYGQDHWAAAMAYGRLKNAEIIDNNQIDFSKTKTRKLASEKIGLDANYHEDLYRQVQDIQYTEKSGNIIEVITISNATQTECSMGDVDVFIVSKHLDSDHSFKK